jgi:hypothetical protein
MGRLAQTTPRRSHGLDDESSLYHRLTASSFASPYAKVCSEPEVLLLAVAVRSRAWLGPMGHSTFVDINY